MSLDDVIWFAVVPKVGAGRKKEVLGLGRNGQMNDCPRANVTVWIDFRALSHLAKEG